MGTGVTMPHKVSVLEHLDYLTPEAKAIGAVNTIYFKGQEWWGTNTDTIGIRDAFRLNLSDEVLGRCRGRPGGWEWDLSNGNIHLTANDGVWEGVHC